MRLVFLVSLFASIVGLQAQPSVNVYLEPESDAFPYNQVPLAKLETLSPEHPVVDGNTDEDWLRVKYPGHYVGFVQTSEVKGDDTFNPGARLFMRSATDSVIIARIQYGDEAKVIDRGPNWSTVDFRGKGAVYYRNPLKFPPSSAPAPSAVVTQARPTVTAPAPPSASGSSVAVSTIPVGPQEGGEILAFDELTVSEAPARPVAQPKAAPRSAQPVVVAPPPPPQAPQRPQAPPPGYTPQQQPSSPAEMENLRKDVPRLYEGTFTRVRGLDFNWFGPSYDYAIDDARGKRIAYVDLKNALLFSSIESYFGKNVVVEGKPEKINGTVPIVIHANFMRLK